MTRQRQPIRLDRFSVSEFAPALENLLAQLWDFLEERCSDAAIIRGEAQMYKTFVDEVYDLCLQLTEYNLMGERAPIAALVTVAGTGQSVIDEWIRLENEEEGAARSS